MCRKKKAQPEQTDPKSLSGRTDPQNPQSTSGKTDSQSVSGQTDPPFIPLIDLFPHGEFPEGEIQQYRDE